jgi:hypothetical protein
MPFCPYCGQETEKEYAYCPHCGGRISLSTDHSSNDQVLEDEYRIFTGTKADYYLSKFRSFLSNRDHFAFTWNWAAFWMGFVWMLYRKMYLWAFLAFLIALTPIALPLTMIVWGMVGNYLYFLQARKKILDYKSGQGAVSSSISLAELGGVNRWVWYAGIVLLLFVLTFGISVFLFFFHLLKNSLFCPPSYIKT